MLFIFYELMFETIINILVRIWFDLVTWQDKRDTDLKAEEIL